MLSWEWTQVLWHLFTFLDGGSPTNPKDQLLLAQRAVRASWTEQHEARAGLLHSQIQQFMRLRCKDTLSRGTMKLDELINKIRPHNSGYQSNTCSIDELTNTAMNIVPSRMSLPEKAGVLDPSDFLKGETLKAFQTLHEWAPSGVEPSAPTKGVFKVLPQDLETVYRQLLESKVACLIPIEQALKDPDGNVISGGLFAVPHKPHSDRIIFDRRPQNELERRLVLARLPHGSLLTQLVVPKGYSVRGSGDDLANFFYLLKHNEAWLGRNCVGKPVDGEMFSKYGGIKGQQYMLSFRVIPMGDHNAVDLAQETHLQILQDCGVMREAESLSFDKPLPATHTLEGLYIDDHLTMQLLPTRNLRDNRIKYRDEDIVGQSREQYARLGLPVSSKKQFTKCANFTAWGTNVDSASGRVGVGIEKLKRIADLIVDVCKLKRVTQKLLQKLVGLIVHPAMHRRILMSLLQDTYTFISGMHSTSSQFLPVAVREELLWVGLCLPTMHSNVRWPVSTRIGASDACLQGGGRAACLTSPAIANTLYRYSEHAGEHVRLDWEKGAVEPPTHMHSAPAELEQLMNAHCWNTTHQCRFSHRQHINILELKMVKAELKDLVRKDNDPYRAVLLVDSRVVVGAYSKGRSSSKQLNRILRSMIGWSIVGQKSLHLVWVGTKANPADHPSRGAKIPSPVHGDPILSALLPETQDSERLALQNRKSNREIRRSAQQAREYHSLGNPLSQPNVPDAGVKTAKHPAMHLWTFREIFAGKGCLTSVFRRQGCFKVGAPVELFQRGIPAAEHDILNDSTFDKLCREACQPKQIWHFGMPCSSFSILQGLNQGTRTKLTPQGNGVLEREIMGNELLHRTVYLCELLWKHNSFFTIENPKSSYAWHMPAMIALLKRSKAEVVFLDQCEYGLQIPDPEGNLGLARKSTAFCGNMPRLSRLARSCKCDHQHVQVIGGIKTKNGWQKRSVLAGAYPPALCRKYRDTCCKLFDV